MKAFKNYLIENSNGSKHYEKWNESGHKEVVDPGDEHVIHTLEKPMKLSHAVSHKTSFSSNPENDNHGVPVLKNFDREGKHEVHRGGLTIPAGTKTVKDRYGNVYTAHPKHGFVASKWRHVNDKHARDGLADDHHNDD